MRIAKKAAATAMSLIWRQQGNKTCCKRCLSWLERSCCTSSRWLALCNAGVEYTELTASRYAAGLRAECRQNEPARLVDTLIVGAIVEARSCERFHALAPYIEADDPELAKYYRSLLRAEGRHFEDYLALAVDRAGQVEVDARLSVFLNL